MLHMIAWRSIGLNPNLAPLTPVPDPTLRVAGNDFYVPSQLNQIVAVAGWGVNTASPFRLQVQSPSLRALLNLDLSPVDTGPTWPSLPALMRMWNTPLQLVTNEPLDAYGQNSISTTMEVVLTLSDGAVKPVTGKIYTVRATGSAPLVFGQWVNTPLVFSQTLPSGHYQCVGFRAVGANLEAARIFFVGAPWRPGVLGSTSVTSNEWPDFRFGNIGIWGEFDNTVPPTVDCLGGTDTAQEFFFDLIKTA